MDFKDYYAILGVDKKASDADIKRAYRKLARQYHPDLNPGEKHAEAKFKEINEANEVLGDPENRRKYDELGANWRQYEHAQPAGGRATHRTMTPEEMEELFGGGGGDPFSDFFHTFFGGDAGPAGRRSGRSRRPTRGHDLEQPVDLSLEDVLSGTTRRVVISGDGADRTVDVRIPAGVKDGARVRAAAKGGSGHGGEAGDLYLQVRVVPHSQFERRGQDLHTRVTAPVTTAVLGGEVSVPTLGGGSVRLRVPELTAAGRVFRLRGHGLPTVGKPDERGDLYATLDVQIPSSLNEEERRRWEALKASERAQP
jgi:DnaJ-class molecular chaperone